jgi:hypothetical protein
LLQNGFAPALLRLICPHGKRSDPSFFENEDDYFGPKDACPLLFLPHVIVKAR